MEAIGRIIDRAIGMFETKHLRTERCEGCGERVQVVEVISKCSLPGGIFKLGCRCEELRIVRDIMAENARRRRERILGLFNKESLISPNLRDASFETFVTETDNQREALAAAKAYVDRFGRGEPENLLFTGPYGTGKSHLAVSIIRALMERGISGIFISVPDMLTKLKATYNKNADVSEDELLEVLKTVDVLVLDDIGAEYSGGSTDSWAVSKIFEVINSRMGMATIYTTNLNGEELQEKLGARNFSRMCENLRVVKFQGKDYRRRKMKV